MADKDKYSFLVVKYPKAETADEALKVILGLAKEKVVRLRDVVAVTKTEKGKIKLHQTKDDPAGKGFIKGGIIGVIFAVLFGPAGWVAAGALLGTAFAMFDRGIKNKLLKELGVNMAPSESALALLIEQADWATAFETMKSHDFKGEIVVSEVVKEDMAEVEKLIAGEEKAVESVPVEMEVPAPVAEAAPAAEAGAAVAVAAAVSVEEAEPEVAAPEVMRKKKLQYIEGVGPAYAQKLETVGIATVEDLLDKGCTKKGRNEIVKATGINDQMILRWVNMADLYRVKGIGSEYAELLEAAGVDTVPELSHRAPANLLQKMQEANEKKKMVRRLPVLSQVENWVQQAKELPRIVEY